MSNIVSIRRDETVNDLWEQYRALATMSLEQPSLSLDHGHCVRVVRAWKRWQDAFIAQESRA